MKTIKQSFLTIVIGLALAAGLSYAAPWVGPTANPPLNNTEAPLNAGGSAQAKSGNLAVGTSAIPTVSLNVGGASNFNGLSQFNQTAIFNARGTPPLRITADAAAGKVLTSDASGGASWQSGVEGGISSGQLVRVYKVNVASGVSNWVTPVLPGETKINSVILLWGGTTWPVPSYFKIYTFTFIRANITITTDRTQFRVTFLKEDETVYADFPYSSFAIYVVIT